jgi:hypothetical protein
MAKKDICTVVGPWESPDIKKAVLDKLEDGYTIVHMAHEVRRAEYVDPQDPNYNLKQFQTRSGDPQLVTYLAKQK